MRGTMIQKRSASFAFEKLSVATPPVSSIENIKIHGPIGREFPSLKSTVTIQFIQSLCTAVASPKTKSKRHCFRELSHLKLNISPDFRKWVSL